MANKLWKQLIDRKIKKTELQKSAVVSANVMARLGKGEYVSLESIEKICVALGCGANDIIDFLP